MTKDVLTMASLWLLVAGGQARPPFQADPPKTCENCEAWNRDRDPVRVFGNVYYVGTAELSSILITSPAGHILIDGAIPQSAPLIDAHIRALGFRIGDVRLIVNSHTHYDHVGGLAALQRASDAVVAATRPAARALREGHPTADDPQFASEDNGFPPIRDVRVVEDGETLHAGDLAITAHLTPGHTPGSTTWTWRSCEGERCLDFVYADSVTAVSAPDYRFTSHPRAVEAFRRGLDTIASLPCDVLLTPHPGASGMDAKLAALARGGANPFVGTGACRAYAANGRRGLDARLATERANPR